jgi:hypothetical protein
LDVPKRKMSDIVDICTGIGMCEKNDNNIYKWRGIPILPENIDELTSPLEKLAYKTLKYLLENQIRLFTMEQLIYDRKLYDVLNVFIVLGILKPKKIKWYELVL